MPANTSAESLESYDRPEEMSYYLESAAAADNL